jgi:hypothetical protein
MTTVLLLCSYQSRRVRLNVPRNLKCVLTPSPLNGESENVESRGHCLTR